MGQFSLFGEVDRLARLSQLGDCLERLKIINWESFRPELQAATSKERKSKAGRPPYDVVMLFKVLVLQRLYNLSDDQTEYQINDRISFMRFLGLTLNDRVPDAKTIWLFRDTLTKAGAIEKLFACFGEQLETQGLITHKGTIVDATFVDAPKQRNTRKENETIKNGEVPEEWSDHPHKLAQKDTDARWAKKNQETHYGYKDHAKVDADSKSITDYAVTSAEVHDSNEFENFLNEEDQVVYADSAYVGKNIPQGVENRVNEKGYKGKPLTEAQKESNRQKSKTRARIEHVFGFITGSMHGLTLRSIGIKRARFNIGLTNLVYNMCRYSTLKRKGPLTTG
jgi:IS5 family transposase